jgi:hypothetical protein
MTQRGKKRMKERQINGCKIIREKKAKVEDRG